MDERSHLSANAIDGKQIIWTQMMRSNAHMKSEPIKRREQLKQAPRLKPKQTIVGYSTNEFSEIFQINPTMEGEKKQIGIVKPLLNMRKEDYQWNCSELEKLQRRFSELLDGKFNDEQTLPFNRTALIERIESLYSSMGTHVHVSPSLVRLFLLTDLQVCSLEQWKLLHRGYPVWLYNTGLNPRRSPELRLLIVDEQTGFILWSDRITSISNLIQPTSSTLSFRHSQNNSSIMLRFETTDEKLFTRFYSYSKQNSSPTEHSLRMKISKRLIRKSDISPPCHFKHFNHLDENHFTNFH